MPDNRNLLLAILLSVGVLGAFEYFYGQPQRDRQQQLVEQNLANRGAETQQTAEGAPAGAQPQTPGAQAPGAQAPDAAITPAGQPAALPATSLNRDQALSANARVRIDTPRLFGSINLRGGRIDDLSLKDYRETVEADSANIVLMSPTGATQANYAEYGWVGAAGANVALPDGNTQWTTSEGATLTADQPLELTWNNGQGLTFTRTITIDEDYMFSITDRVENAGADAVTIHPYGLVSRHGRPQVQGFYILHEGLLGYLGEGGLQEIHYKDLEEEGQQTSQQSAGWLGITDKYWATALIPPQGGNFTARFAATTGEVPVYQADYLLGAVEVQPGQSAENRNLLFAGAKEVGVIDGYEASYAIPRFELMIDWGWFYFVTKPMFYAIDFFFRLFGNFGIAILVVTVLVKLVFFPLANKSYTSMSKMKKIQPELMAMRDKFKDDRAAQQKAMMELYQKEKINPLAGCLPILIQIPVFFALYKVLFVTIEMRHAPFFGWIRDLSAPDPTTIFNLFGLLPYDPSAIPFIGAFLMLGAWPLLMGISMFIQMRLNPIPPDPTQAMIFTWMPVIFTFLLASFPAGLVIYWTWNNTLSVLQQAFIMKRQGVKIELWDNLTGMFRRKPKTTGQ